MELKEVPAPDVPCDGPCLTQLHRLGLPSPSFGRRFQVRPFSCVMGPGASPPSSGGIPTMGAVLGSCGDKAGASRLDHGGAEALRLAENAQSQGLG